jgi:hypothetical protein
MIHTSLVIDEGNKVLDELLPWMQRLPGLMVPPENLFLSPGVALPLLFCMHWYPVMIMILEFFLPACV